ncbi:MAG: hypothetical protein NXH95_15490 [Pseudomonadaceae bacterium]|nr:hypothetical protein [Pseudomonadaceae bacterium]
MAAPPDKPSPASEDEQHPEDYDLTLEGVLELLAREIERLQASLDTYRSSDHPSKQALIRWHVQQIDARHDRLDEIKQMILKRNNGEVH